MAVSCKSSAGEGQQGEEEIHLGYDMKGSEDYVAEMEQWRHDIYICPALQTQTLSSKILSTVDTSFQIGLLGCGMPRSTEHTDINSARGEVTSTVVLGYSISRNWSIVQ